MTILYQRDQDGGFLVGNTENRLTTYAYPRSELATEARSAPVRTAHEMAQAEKANADLRTEPTSAGMFVSLEQRSLNNKHCRERDDRLFTQLEAGQRDGTTRAVVRLPRLDRTNDRDR